MRLIVIQRIRILPSIIALQKNPSFYYKLTCKTFLKVLIHCYANQNFFELCNCHHSLSWKITETQICGMCLRFLDFGGWRDGLSG